MADSDQNCLICLAQGQGVPLRKLRTSNNTGNTNCSEDSLSEQIQVMVLLRKVLCLRNSFLESVLQDYEGRNPSSWDLRLCRLCLRMFEEAMFVWERLNKLHVEFEDVSGLLRSKMIQVVREKGLDQQQEEHGSEEVNVPTKRKPGRPPRRKIRRAAKLLNDDSSVAIRIRREFALRHCKTGAFRHVLKSERSEVFVPAVIAPASYTIRDDTEESVALPEERSFQDPLNDDPEDNFYSHDAGMDISNNPSPVPQDEEEWQGDSNGYQDMDNDIGLTDAEAEASYDDDDSDFEPTRSSSRRSRVLRKRKRTQVNYAANHGALASAIKMENATGFQCSECQKTFSSSAQCDEHILHDHYGGAWPEGQSCPLCPTTSFKGVGRLRAHLKNRHPEYKLPVDKALERCIEKGTVPEITYDVVPFGGSSSKAQLASKLEGNEMPRDDHSNSISFIRTVDEAPPNYFSVPIIQNKGGKPHYVVLPDSFCEAMPEHVLSLLTRGPVDKKCELCEWTVPTEMQMRAHVKRSHEGEESCYYCPICPKSYGRIKKLLTHMQKTHVTGKFVCKHCGNLFNEEIMMLAHIQRVHLGITHPFECVKCGAKSPTRSVLNKHMKRVHKVQIVKPPKVRKAVVKKPSRPVKKRIRPLKNIPCKLCLDKTGDSLKFATEQELDVHVKRKHMGISRPYPCPVCGKKYSRPWLVDEHLQTHTVRNDVEMNSEAPPPKEEFLCHPCDKSFKSKAIFENHLKGRNHKNLRPYVCELCSETFTTIRILETHQSLKHHEELGIDPFKCQFCDKILGCKRTLNAHIRVRHTKQAKYKCPDCDCYFEWIQGLNKHVEIRHAKLNPLLCPYCPKSFAQDLYLKNHMRTHTGEKPYQCNVCSKKFADKPTYNRHMEAHSDIVHNCSYCGKTGIKTRHALRVHMKTFHRDILEQLDRESKLKQYVPSTSLESDSTQIDGAIADVTTGELELEIPSTSKHEELQCNSSNFVNDLDPLMGE